MNAYKLHEVVKEEMYHGYKIQIIKLYDTFSALIFNSDNSINHEVGRVNTHHVSDERKIASALWIGKNSLDNKIDFGKMS